MSILETITILMCGLGMLALILFLVFNLKHEYSRVYLAILLFSIIFTSFNGTLIQSGLMLSLPYIYRTGAPFIFIMGPAVYFYVRTAIDRSTSFDSSFLLHLIPAAIAFIAYMPLYTASIPEKVHAVETLYAGGTIFSHNEGWLPTSAIYIGSVVSGVIYSILSLIRISKTEKGRPQIPRRWLTVMAVFVLVVFVTFGLAYFKRSIESFNLFAYFHASISFLLVINLYMRPDILYGIETIQKEPPPAKVPLLPDDKLQEFARRVETFMEEQEPYLDPGLSLNAMANEIGIPRNQLSWVINQYFEMNFNEFVNNYRIDHILNHYSKSQFRQLTMEGIAQEVGFRSRNTFILAVKKRSGQTPTEYFKRI